MIRLDFQGAPALLLDDPPDWVEPLRLTLELPAARQRGLSGRETRAPLAATLRARLGWSAPLDPPAYNALRAAAQAAADDPVLCPAWPFALPGTAWAAAPVTGGLLVAWQEDGSARTVTDTLADPAAWDWVAPCLVGRLEAPPRLRWPAAGRAVARFAFLEDGPALYALAPAPQAWSAGPALGDGSAPPRFPCEVHWLPDPEADAPDLERETRRLGPAPRQSARAAWPQSPARLLAASVQPAGRAEIAALLRWFADRRGPVEPHYVVESPPVTALAAPAAAGATALIVADPAALGANRFLELRRPGQLELVRVTALTGATLTLAAPLAHAWPADALTLVRLAVLVRHADESLELEFARPDLAEGRLTWREVPAEYTPASGETRGLTLGPAPLRAWLYEVTADWRGATETHRFTSFERDLVAGGHTWTSRPCDHSELRQSLALDRDELTLTVRWWPGGPFRLFLPNALEARLTLALYECEVDGGTGTALVQRFGGELTGLSADGPFLRAGAAGANALFDRRFPRRLLQAACNHALFDAGCGLDRAAWTATATVYNASGPQLTLEGFSFPGGPPAGFGTAHWFALGLLTRAPGGVLRRQAILDSTALAAGRLTVTLPAAPAPAPLPGETVSLTPGCDGRRATCQAYNATSHPEGRFANEARFGGFPFLPDKNPSFQPLKKSTSAAGKK